MFLGGKLCYLAAVSVLYNTCFVQSQEEKFAGNLVPDSDDVPTADRTELVHATDRNFTEASGGSVHVVPSSDGDPGAQGRADIDPKPHSKVSPKKAPRPLGKPESVGFVPPPQEEEEGIKEIVTEKGKPVVASIPSLPARFARFCVWCLI